MTVQGDFTSRRVIFLNFVINNISVKPQVKTVYIIIIFADSWEVIDSSTTKNLSVCYKSFRNRSKVTK